MDRWLADLRYSCRTLARTPAFTVVVVLTLALGIGATTAVYAVADAALFRPFPYPDMNRLVLIAEATENGQPMSVSWPNYQDWKQQQDVLSEIGVYRTQTVTLSGTGDPERLNASLASSAVFASMGIQTLIGHVFGESDDLPSAPRTVLVSERLWRTRFAAHADLVGQALTLDNEPYTVIGVMPAAMRFPSKTVDIWLPLGPSIQGFPPRGAHPGLQGVARLKPGVSIRQARAGMDAVAKRLSDQYPDTNRKTSSPCRLTTSSSCRTFGRCSTSCSPRLACCSSSHAPISRASCSPAPRADTENWWSAPRLALAALGCCGSF